VSPALAYSLSAYFTRQRVRSSGCKFGALLAGHAPPAVDEAASLQVTLRRAVAGYRHDLFAPVGLELLSGSRSDPPQLVVPLPVGLVRMARLSSPIAFVLFGGFIALGRRITPIPWWGAALEEVFFCEKNPRKLQQAFVHLHPVG